MDHGSQIVLQKVSFFARPEAGEHQDGFAYAGFANVDAFIGAGHAEPVGTGLLKDSGDLRAAVTVGVALDDGEHLAWDLALFVWRVDEGTDGAEIVGERGRGDFRPHGAGFDFQLAFLARRHSCPERKIVYDIRAAGVEAPRGCCVKGNSQVGCKREARPIGNAAPRVSADGSAGCGTPKLRNGWDLDERRVSNLHAGVADGPQRRDSRVSGNEMRRLVCEIDGKRMPVPCDVV